MINLVKAELCYMKTEWLRAKWAYLLICFFFLVMFTIVAVAFFTAADGKSFDYARYIFAIINIALGFLPIVYVVLQLQLLIREGREKRCRLYCLLPLAIKEIGYARLLTPFILLVAFTIAAGILIPIYFNVESAVPFSGEGLINMENPWLALGIIPFTYGLRLFSEKNGIILGSLFLGITALGSIYIGTGNERDYIIPLFHNFVEYINNPVSFIVMTILFVMLIHLSFIARKSYLR